MTQPGWFADHVRVAGWLVLHCGVADAREFLRMKAGPERDVVIAAINAAEERREDEAADLANRLAEALGGGE